MIFSFFNIFDSSDTFDSFDSFEDFEERERLVVDDWVSVGVAVGDNVEVAVGDNVEVAVGVSVGVAVGVSVGVAVGDNVEVDEGVTQDMVIEEGVNPCAICICVTIADVAGVEWDPVKSFVPFMPEV